MAVPICPPFLGLFLLLLFCGGSFWRRSDRAYLTPTNRLLAMAIPAVRHRCHRVIGASLLLSFSMGQVILYISLLSSGLTVSWVLPWLSPHPPSAPFLRFVQGCEY
ncbi:hypothetical protein BJV77DRAFT_298074 [Russula vinacea]|nr:hypothetical protein BJV77DRAFT_298074 [Russula vinacea]